jgi:hypothetical protein
MENNNSDFLSRLNSTSGNLDITPWLVALGFSPGTVNRVVQDKQAPGADLLRALQRTERISLLWLEEGRGTPYNWTPVFSDEEVIAALERLDPSAPSWSILLATQNEADFALVLYRDAQYEFKGKPIDYREVEVLGGRITLKTVAWLRDHAQRQALWLLPLSKDEFERLNSGHMGNMELFGWGGPAQALRWAVEAAASHSPG